jgi:hypothetical protein
VDVSVVRSRAQADRLVVLQPRFDAFPGLEELFDRAFRANTMLLSLPLYSVKGVKPAAGGKL